VSDGTHLFEPTMKKIRLLIVDDHIDVRDALQVSLSSKPHLEVLTSDADLQTVAQTLGSVAPDVVLFEPKSLSNKGLQTCRTILASESQPAVIILTSYHSEKEAMVLSELGVSRYLLKDIDSQRLYDEILQCYAERQERISS
jgi:DNA-binding NarL/FixJ family response regulator